MDTIAITKELAQKVKETVSHGLVKGLGKPKLGQMCVEAAVNYACGLPHGDNPSCVGKAVRSFKIRLNDAKWSSNDARAIGMLKIAIAQLGSNIIDQVAFAKIVVFKTITVLMVAILNDNGYNEEAILCENSKTLLEAKDNIWSIKNKLYAVAAGNVADASAYAANVASAYAANAAEAAAYAAAEAAAAYAAADAAEAAAEAAAYAAAEAAEAAAEAAAYAAAEAAEAAATDKYLLISANICLEALIELKSPGCEFLYLCD